MFLFLKFVWINMFLPICMLLADKFLTIYGYGNAYKRCAIKYATS